MDIKSIAAIMYPNWLLGAFMVWATINSKYKELVKIDKKAVFNWIKFLLIITLYRIIVLKLFPGNFREASRAVTSIPWPLTLTVFWEDATHGLPLLLIRKFIGTKWYTWPLHIALTLILMLEFGMGHVYQGIFAATLLSLYVPYSVRLGNKYGFGTIMICHTLYDLSTILSLNFIAST